MERVALTLSTTILLTVVCFAQAIAQAVPQLDHLSRSQRQQLSRDLVPSSAQDFFATGQTAMEQEVQRLIRPRSTKNLLNVKVQPQREPEPLKQVTVPPHDQGLAQH